MFKKGIVLLESNVGLLAELKNLLEKQTGNTVLYAGDDGEEGLRETLRLKPALLLVGMFLKGVDGCAVIRSVKQEELSTKIIAVGVSSDTLIERAMNEGADYYLVKPFSLNAAMERIEDLLKDVSDKPKEISDFMQAKKKPTTLEEKITDIFISIGIPPHIKGYAYLREGIKITVKNPHIINNVTKGLYPSIAKTFGTTSSKVERAIRHAIEVAWNRARIDAINAIFGARIYLGSEKPTNSEFIALVADKLILENLI